MTQDDSLRRALQASPQLFPLDMDAESVQLIGLTEREYAEASFLDQRLLQSGKQFAMVRWPEVSAAATGLNPDCDFIFHISHTGSTLVSRLLGLHAQLFSVREPLLLRRLAQGQHRERLETILAVLSRTYHAGQRPIVKATSFVSEIGCPLMSCVPGARAILMYIQPEKFLCALLSGAMSDIATAGAARLRRLQNRGMLEGLRLTDLAPAECVAMSWLAEMVSLAEIADQFPSQSFWLDFDEFLTRPALHLSELCRHLNVQDRSGQMVESDLLSRYAKKTEVVYDKDYRGRLLDAARQQFDADITVGMNWLEIHAKSFQWNAVSI